MTSTLLAQAAELDADIQALDRRYFIARVNGAPPETLQRLEAERNVKAHQWGAAVQTRQVTP